MVDAAARIHDSGPAGQAELSARVEAGPDAHARHAAFCRNAFHGPAQHPSWVSRWAEHVNADVLFVTVSAGGDELLRLPLETVPDGLGRIAIAVGGRHANGNFPAIAKGAVLPEPTALAAAIATAVRRDRPDISLLSLERLQPAIGGCANPLILPDSPTSPNVALAVDLAGGFEATLQRHSGKRKRKKHRSNERKFQEQGDVRVYCARTAAEARHLLDAFFTVKAARFASMGIQNVFGSAEVQRFFHDLFADALADGTGNFVLHGLEVGGTVRAVTGSSLCDDRMICEFSGFLPDETTNTSPGDYLFFETIRWACENGFAVHDFSVGDEPYKRLWCDIEAVQHDTLIALNTRGHVSAAVQSGASALKRTVKNSAPLWAAYKALRRMRNGN